MKTQTKILVNKDGRRVHTAYPWDSEQNRQWNKERLEKLHGKLEWQDGPTVETMSP